MVALIEAVGGSMLGLATRLGRICTWGAIQSLIYRIIDIGSFRWEACNNPRELRRQIIGAAIIGTGPVIALGCTVGQGLSAFSVLPFSARVTFLSIFAGAVFGLRLFIEGFSVAE